MILSGSGSDGTLGARSIKAQGGIVFAQDASAQHAEMPASATQAGCVDAVLSPEGIARELIRLDPLPAVHDARDSATSSTSPESAEAALDALVRKLSLGSQIDFSNYKQTTVRRRIHRRMLLLGLDQLEDYVAYFEQHAEETNQLHRDLLIHVTSFFRDPEVFQALAEEGLPLLLKDRAPGTPLRIWVPGCSTGEEVYSLAICLLESLGPQAESFPIKLFGTDVSEDALRTARAGRYTSTVTADLSPERLRLFFTKDGDSHVVTKAIRELCVFARQDATRDAPISNVDLISCRNLLIYLGSALQQRVMPVFHYALREGGLLLLGKAESVGATGELFSTVDEGCSLYARKSVPRRAPLGPSGVDSLWPGGPAFHSPPGSSGRLDAQHEADRVVLQRYAPAGVLIDEELSILQFRGETGAYLAPAPGSPSNNLLRMARPGLLPDLRAIVAQGKELLDGELSVLREGVRIQSDSGEQLVDLALIPVRVPGRNERLFVILFERGRELSGGLPLELRPAASAPTGRAPEESSRVTQLERELSATRDYLRASVERVEVANEDLRAANEEILSSNEELQSTNQELQTSKEELQASNEELLTINEEMRHRNREVALLGDDLTNLLSSVKIPILILGQDLRIRRCTPSAATLFGVSASDIGQRLTELDARIRVVDLEQIVLEVLDSFAVVERELQDVDGHWYALSVWPYRTQDNKVDGAVLSLADIDALKRVSQSAERARDFAESIVAGVREPLLVLGVGRHVRKCNDSFCKTLDKRARDVEGRRLEDCGLGSWLDEDLLRRLDEVREGARAILGLEVRAEVPGLGLRILQLDARSVPGGEGDERLVLLAILDETRAREEAEEKQLLARKLEQSQRLESLGVLAGGIAHDFNNILTAVLGFAQLTRADLPTDSKSGPHLEAIEASVFRAAELCAQMLAYSGKGRFRLAVIDLCVLVLQSRQLLEAMVSRRAILVYQLPDSLPRVEADIVQIRQVLMNLVINAAEALGEEGGRVLVTAGTMRADRAYLDQTCIPDLPAGEYVYLEVSDKGLGMAPETRARIFDPFFTTKFAGRGLGLAAVLGIVRSHRGSLALDSELGRGTNFRLLLPSTRRAEDALQATLDSRTGASGGLPDWRCSGTVLVVDDEPEIGTYLERVLPQLGFRVEVVRSGEAAIESLHRIADQCVVVLLDLTMPGLSGLETHRRILELSPGLPVILMSGYAEEDAMSHFRDSRPSSFLAKPFTLLTLVDNLRHALDPPDPQAPPNP